MRLLFIILALALPGAVCVRHDASETSGDIGVQQESTVEADPASVPVYVQLIPDTADTGGCGSQSFVAKGCCRGSDRLATLCTFGSTKFPVGKFGTQGTGFFNPAPVQDQSSKAWLSDIGAGKFTAYRGTMIDSGQTYTGYQLASVRCAKKTTLTRVWPECAFKDASAQPCSRDINPAAVAREALDRGLCESMRLRLQPQDWMKWGWSPTSPGFVHWIAAASQGQTQLVYGCAMLGEKAAALTPLCNGNPAPVELGEEFRTLLGDVPEQVVEIAHQYTTDSSEYQWHQRGQQFLDWWLEYHTILVIQWKSKKLTVLELGWRNGNSGSKTQQSNFYPDRLVFPPEMVAPYSPAFSELRMYDMPTVHTDGYATTTIPEFLLWMQQSPHGKARFMPKSRHGAAIHKEIRPVNLEVAPTRAHILAGMLNYLHRGNEVRGDYDAKYRNCQTFSSDGYMWLTGTTSLKPVSTYLFYTKHSEWFQA